MRILSALKIKPSTYYNWRHWQPSRQEKRRESLKPYILDVWKTFKFYGYRRIAAYSQQTDGPKVSEYMTLKLITKNEFPSLYQNIIGNSDQYMKYDTQNNIIDKTRLEDDKHDYWVDILFKSLDANFSNNDFQISITDQIETDGKLTINQAKCLRNFYNNLNPNEQSAFKHIVSIKLRKDFQKNQYALLKGYDKDFIDMLLSSQQRKIVEFI